MLHNVHLEVVSGYESARANAQPISDDSVLRARAIELARSLDWLPNVATSTFISDRWQALLVPSSRCSRAAMLLCRALRSPMIFAGCMTISV